MHLANTITTGSVLLLGAFLISCSDSVVEPPPAAQQPTTMVRELPADTGKSGHHTFFRFADSSVVPVSDSATTRWDIGFNGTSMIVNGGANGPGQGASLLLEGVDFDTLGTAPESGYTPGTVSKDWYLYTGPSGNPPHTILPKPGVVIVLRTAEGKYAKMQITSYYQGAPANPTGLEKARFYTFRYFVQPDGSRTLKN